MKERDKIAPKFRSNFSKEETEKFAKNSIALTILFCGLDSNKFNRVSTCDTAKEVWDILDTAHEGTSQVRESRINLYVH